jgi:hypothetical protein
VRSFSYAILGIRNDVGYAVRLLRYHAWHGIMWLAWKIDILFVRLHTHAFAKASKARRNGR